MKLTGRGVLITGGNRIGAAVAIDLARAGADVAVVYNRSRDQAEATAADVRAAGRRATVLQGDLSNADDCRRVVDDAASGFGRLDVLVNMASLYERKDYDALTEQDWDRALAVDLKAVHLCAQAAVPHLRRQSGGRIVNFTDWVAASGRPRYTGYLPYYVAKMGVIGLTQILALELAADGILVNAVAPGPILAPPGTSDEEIAAVEKATPLGRWGGPEEIARAVRFLVETDFVTGEVVRVDGGRHVR
ncbi:MAG: SDR family oxidoreductase [Vicinamibacteria bacterium]|nr:SDR family oxidoreductase [Vicinamibacteria bacterium]